jgi:pimeloyl-ACP methyl ester carboxylesterase
MGKLAVEGDRSIHFEHYPGEGRPVILSHGWGESCRTWDTTLPALLENGNEVVMYDHRCCGQSDKDFRDVSIEALGSDIVALVDHLGLSGVVLNGWSLGGAVVVDAASKLGDRCAGVVSTCGATPRYTQADGFPHGGTAEIVDQTVGALRADRATFLHGLYFQGVFHSESVSEQVKTFCWLEGLKASPMADPSLGSLGDLDQREMLASLQMPVLVTIGVHDAVVDPGITRAAAEMAPNGTGVEFDDSGHAPHLEEPAKYQSELVSFVNGLG